ncbi:GAF domain-containing protein [Sorangium sp. So ce1000]|uniref:GAF domain-containing protein n=1 Tax=Sorangium sp. So ce1000 TaxID=3133325 RepID=UPI003F627364
MSRDGQDGQEERWGEPAMRRWRSTRARASALEGRKRRLARRARALGRLLGRVRKAHGRLEARAFRAEAALASAADRCAEVERQRSQLANLYVASRRLLPLRTREEACRALQDIIANLVGSEEIAVFEVDGSGAARVVAAYGVDPASAVLVAPGEGIVGRVARRIEPYFRQGAALGSDAAAPQAPRARGEDDVMACIPLTMDERVVGVIAVFHLLLQKPELGPLDRDLLEALGTLAAGPFCAGRERCDALEGS